MKWKFAAAALASVITISLILGGCGKNASPSESGKSSPTEETADTSITLINNKNEVAEQINQLASAYKSETGVTVNVKNIPSGVDAQATVTGLYLSDQMPDIIVCEATAFSNWDGLLTDMSGEDWTKRTDAAYIDKTYGTIGFPFTTEAIGLTYNADILEKADVDPVTLTNPEAYREAFETIDSKKDELGLTAIVGYCTEPENMGWSAGNHIFGAYLDSGLDRADTKYIDLLNNGAQFDDERLHAFAEFIGLLQKYSDPALLTTGTYDDQVRHFACGKYAFVTQGSWIGATLIGAYSEDYAIAGNFAVGMAPYAFEDGIDTILTNPPSWWAVPKEGNAEAAKAFLQWCSGDSAQNILVKQAGFISPFSDCKYIADDPFAPVISSYLSSGKTSSWHWMDMKEGLGTKALCYAFNAYAEGETDADGFVEDVKQKTAVYMGVITEESETVEDDTERTE